MSEQPSFTKLLLTPPEITELDRKNSSELFAYLLADPLLHVIDGGRERYLIVIDALDEAGGHGRSELVETLHVCLTGLASSSPAGRRKMSLLRCKG